MRRLTALLTVLLALALALAACGNDSDKDTTTNASSKSSTKAKSASQTATPPTYTITAHDGNGKYSFDVPSNMKGGVITLVLDNTAGKEQHDFQLASVVPGHTLDELLKQVTSENAPLETWVKAAGGVATVAPGRTDKATLDLPPGDYWYFCTESNQQTNTPHATHGMQGTLTLTGTSGAAMPKADATVIASEYKFDVSGLHSGPEAVEFKNVGNQIHMGLFAPIQAGKTIDDVKKAFSAPPNQQSGPPPVDMEHAQGFAVVDHGQSEIQTLNLSPGKYALLCFMTNKGTAGPPHFMMGMLQEVDIS